VAFLTWDTSYSVSVKSFDAAHQKLFSLINELHSAMKSGKGRTIIAATLGELEKYTHTHFVAEEAQMERAGYPGLNHHRGEHRTFIAKVKEFKEHVEAGELSESVEVMTFLTSWLKNHIMETDKKYSAHLNSRGIN
jgi:hemerythrin